MIKAMGTTTKSMTREKMNGIKVAELSRIMHTSGVRSQQSFRTTDTQHGQRRLNSSHMIQGNFLAAPHFAFWLALARPVTRTSQPIAVHNPVDYSEFQFPQKEPQTTYCKAGFSLQITPPHSGVEQWDESCLLHVFPTGDLYECK